MKVFKITLMVIDFDEVEDEIASIIENTKFPNRCISPEVTKIESRDVEWTDEHPLNNYELRVAEFERLFTETPPTAP